MTLGVRTLTGRKPSTNWVLTEGEVLRFMETLGAHPGVHLTLDQAVSSQMIKCGCALLLLLVFVFFSMVFALTQAHSLALIWFLARPAYNP